MSPVIDNATDRKIERIHCLEIDVDGTALRFADGVVEDANGYWRPLIKTIGPFGEALDPEGLSLNISPVQIELTDAEDDPQGPGYWGPLAGAVELQNRPAVLSVRVREGDGSWSSQDLYAGVISAQELTPGGTIKLELRSTILERLGIAQRVIDKDRFSAAPDESLGLGMNIVLGTMASTSGAVQCQLIDTANRRFAVAQHWIDAVLAVNRVRGGVNTRLTAVTHYSVVTHAVDGRGDPYAYVQIEAAQWQAGDLIFADVRGHVRRWLALDGTSEYAYVADDADFDITGDLTLEVLFYLSSVSGNQALISRYNGAASGFGLRSIAQNIQLVVPTGSVVASLTTTNAPLEAWRVYYLKCTYDVSAAEGSFYLADLSAGESLLAAPEIARGNNSTQTNCSRNGTLPNALTPNNITLSFGVLNHTSAQTNFLGGAIGFAGLHAVESDNGTPIGPTGANCRGYWRFAGDLTDASGNGHVLNGVNIEAGDYVLDTNPATLLRDALLNPDWGWGLSEDDLDAASWDDAAALCTARGYDASGAFGACVPRTPGSSGSPVEGRDAPWEVIQEVARDLSFTLVPIDGRLGLRSIDPTAVTAGTLTRFAQDEGHLTPDPLQFNLRPLRVVNGAAFLYALAQAAQSSFEGAAQADNTASQSRFGYAGDVLENRAVRSLAVMKDVGARRFALSSGGFRLVRFTAPALVGFRPGCAIGDQVLLTHRRALGSWTDQPVQIVSRQYQPAAEQMGVTFEALTVGTQIGTTKWSVEETVEVAADLTTFIGASQVDDFPDGDAAAGSGYGGLSYLRLGHHYSIDHDDFGWSFNVNWRALVRWTLPSAVWTGRTITAVTIIIEVTQVPDLVYHYHDDIYRSIWLGKTLNKFTQTTWDGSTSFNALGGLGGYSGYVSTQFGTFPGGLGEKSILLPAGAGGGVEMFAKAAAGTGQGASGRDVNLCLGDFGSGNYTNACKLAKTIKALITYTAS